MFGRPSITMMQDVILNLWCCPFRGELAHLLRLQNVEVSDWDKFVWKELAPWKLTSTMNMAHITLSNTQFCIYSSVYIVQNMAHITLSNTQFSFFHI